MKPLHLHPGRERRILQGHRWIFSNEIADPLSEFEPGSWVEVYSARGVLLGSGYINPHSLIAVRLVCRPGQKPTREFFYNLIEGAISRRETLYPGSQTYRAVYAESDGLPGLVADRYGEVVVYQATTLGMARMEPLIRELLIELLKPTAIIFRNDTNARTLEGLPLEKGVAYGEVPHDYWVNVDGIEFQANFQKGQKTGFYLDQRENRSALRRFAQGRRVLDLFCYTGGWGLAAAQSGAAEVVGVDQSSESVAQAIGNASRNNLSDRCRFVEGEAFHYLKSIQKGAFDLVILDPPAFAKTRAALSEARKGYTDLNRRALLALKPGGILVSCSCSYHMSEELFRESLLQASQASGRELRVLEARGQAADHPILLAMPETRYLKCYFMQVI